MDEIKIGMIGLDTSHSIEFTEIFNNRKNKHHLKGAKVVIAYPGGTPEFSKSISRVPAYSEKIQKEYGVKLVNSIDEIGSQVDAFLLESCDGRQHLDQFKKIVSHGKPVFIDKPFACSLKDAKDIIQLSKVHHIPIFSASSLRYYTGIRNFAKNSTINALEVHGPVELFPDYPGYFWYGPHLVEIALEFLGPGCEGLHVIKGDSTDIISARWTRNRNVVLIGYRNTKVHDWGVTLFKLDKIITSTAVNRPPGYAFLLDKILKFFQSGISPISNEEILESISILEKINLSSESNAWIQL